jgi:hypothetical protein
MRFYEFMLDSCTRVARIQEVSREREVKSGGVRLPSAKATTYQMYLTIDGQKRFRSTKTSDYDDAVDKLKEWEAQAKIGTERDHRPAL